jgi:hypothetical protein
MDFNLTSGYSQYADDQYQQYYLNEMMVMLGVFTEDATRLAGLYCLHSGRNSVTKEDMELALKTRAYHGDTFWNRNDIQQKIAEMRQFLSEPTSDSEDEYESDHEYNYENTNEGEMSELSDEEMEDAEGFIKSECTCELCTTLNEIQEKWNTWNPGELMNQLLKNSIDDTFRSQPVVDDL